MFKRLLACLSAILMFTAIVLAHGDATHLAGTVTAVGKDTVTVKLQSGKSEVVMLEKGTKYLTGTKPAAAADLKPGIRVVIDAKMDEKMKMYTAEEVRIGVAEKAARRSRVFSRGLRNPRLPRLLPQLPRSPSEFHRSFETRRP